MAHCLFYLAALLGLVYTVMSQGTFPGTGTGTGTNPGFNPNPISAQCPQGQRSGQFAYQNDCSKYIQCDNGVATVLPCPSQLVFNPQNKYCDYPHNVQNPTCRMSVTSQGLTPQTATLCQTNPHGGRAQDAFMVAHPTFCNAFYTCSIGYLYAPCTFCPEDMYFSQLAGRCLDGRFQDQNAICTGKQMVAHKDKVMRQLDGACWPFANRKNPYETLLQKIRGGGFNNNNNNNFNPNNNNNNNNFPQG